jgi:hypothetical protein
VSDKPIPAEVVRADQIRVGDRILCFGAVRTAISISHDDPECVLIAFAGLLNGEEQDFPKDAPVARVQPEPVEVRDQWLVEYFENGMQFFVPAIDRDHAFEVAKTLKGGVSVLCERLSIISREEVQP